MELRHLRYFIAVAEEQNVTRAAKRLHVAQPPLSKQIHDLEDEMGIALFERTPKTIRLTHAGRIFLDEARAVLQRLDEAVLVAKAAAIGERGELRVGYAPFLTAEIVPRALQIFQESHPGVRLKLRDLSTEEMAQGLRDHTLDLALMVEVTAKVLPDCEFVELRRHAVCVAVPPTHRLARSRKISLKQLAAERLLAFAQKEYPDYHAWLSQVFAALEQPLLVAEEYDSATSLMSAVEGGRGFALVLETFQSFVGSRVKLIPLSRHSLAVGAAWLKTANASKAREEFMIAAKRASENRAR